MSNRVITVEELVADVFAKVAAKKALRLDAERYRALRLRYKDFNGYDFGFSKAEDLDDFADAAIRARTRRYERTAEN